jgi:hypothetical protein
MRTEQSARGQPILMQFAERIVVEPNPSLRYDTVRQIMQVKSGDHWLDAVDSGLTLEALTKKTGVGQETTDDD